MLTQEDETFITEMFESFENENETEDEVNLNENAKCMGEDDEIIYLMEIDLTDMATNLANNSFEHSINTREIPEGLVMLAKKSKAFYGQQELQGIRIDTCANRTSVMGEGQYLSYCQKFGLKPALRIGPA